MKFPAAADAKHRNAVVIDPNSENFSGLIGLVLAIRPTLGTRAIVLAFGVGAQRHARFRESVKQASRGHDPPFPARVAVGLVRAGDRALNRQSLGRRWLRVRHCRNRR